MAINFIKGIKKDLSNLFRWVTDPNLATFWFICMVTGILWMILSFISMFLSNGSAMLVGLLTGAIWYYILTFIKVRGNPLYRSRE